MEGLSESQCSGLAIDHLGLVADKIDDLDLVKLIDDRLPIVQGRGSKVSMGERVAAMILNGLGFVDSRLYLFSEFLSKRPISRLFGKPMQAEWFNDDAMGRCLDAISAYGTTKLFTELSFQIGARKGLLGRSAHFDTTTLQLYGEYPEEVDQVMSKPVPSRGYSKSHRHDLKQMVLNLATTGSAAFPVWMESHSGNSSDKKILPAAAKKMQELCQSLQDVGDFIYVGDSAMYSNILPHSSDMKWLSRVPDNIAEANALLASMEEELLWHDLSDGYRYHATEAHYGGVKQRWVLIYSQSSYEREVKTVEKRIAKERKEYDKYWWHLSNEVFTCEQDALQAAKKLCKKMRYHKAEYTVEAKLGHAKVGRPKVDESVIVKGYQVQYDLCEDSKLIEQIKRKKGRFILSTNELEQSKMPDSEILSEYKAQSGTERGFKFIKDNSFEVDSVYLKIASRIDALMMVMTLCLMVYGVSQYDLRKALERSGESVLNQLRKPTNKPSMKWVYFLFQGIQELTIDLTEHSQTLVINVNPLLKQIVGHFGSRAQCVYLNPA